MPFNFASSSVYFLSFPSLAFSLFLSRSSFPLSRSFSATVHFYEHQANQTSLTCIAIIHELYEGNTKSSTAIAFDVTLPLSYPLCPGVSLSGIHTVYLRLIVFSLTRNGFFGRLSIKLRNDKFHLFFIYFFLQCECRNLWTRSCETFEYNSRISNNNNSNHGGTPSSNAIHLLY